MDPKIRNRGVVLLLVMIAMTVASKQVEGLTGTCGNGETVTLPFTDVPGSNQFFCSIASAYFSGLANGQSGTIFNPSGNVTREQMAAFVSRTMDQSLKRGSLRAALNQYWTTKDGENIALTDVGNTPRLVQSDGADVWVANHNTVSRVRGKDGKLVDTWTDADLAFGVLCARGFVYVTGGTTSPKVYYIDPTQPGGMVGTLSPNVGNSPQGIAYDGQRIWTANASGSVSMIGLGFGTPVTTVSTGFVSPQGIIYDGTNMWITDNVAGSVDKLIKLDSAGAILQPTVNVGDLPQFPAFDGTNIWVPNYNSGTVTVVRAAGALAGTVIATLPGFSRPTQVAFDGERILVTNNDVHSVSLLKASDLTSIGQFPVTTGGSPFPFGACSDGINFWITLNSSGKLARF